MQIEINGCLSNSINTLYQNLLTIKGIIIMIREWNNLNKSLSNPVQYADIVK